MPSSSRIRFGENGYEQAKLIEMTVALLRLKINRITQLARGKNLDLNKLQMIESTRLKCITIGRMIILTVWVYFIK